MNPCSKHRQSITWMALGSLDEDSARELRLHLDACPACRDYSREVAAICQEHQAAAAVLPQGQAGESFHRQLRRRIEADAERPALTRILEAVFRLVGPRMLRATAATTVAAALLMAGVWFWPHLARQASTTTTTTTAAQPASRPMAATDSPTLAHYRLVANASLDSLDDLLSRQAGGGSAPGPGFTLSALSRTVLEN